MNDFPFVIMTIPERKKPCLFYRDEQNSFVKIAQFSDHEAQEVFVALLNRWINETIGKATDAIADLIKLPTSAKRPSRWIAVKEKLPEPFISVLIYAPEQHPYPTVHEGYVDYEGKWHTPAIYDILPEEVTHWMPMPEPPVIEITTE